MQRINTTNKATDLFGAGKHGYRAGNPAIGQSATELSFDVMNALQEEISGVIEGSGSALNAASNAQLLAAIQKLAEGRIGAGNVAFFATATAPNGWLKANGALISRTAYASLFAAIGTTFGVGDGATTFALPDLRGEFLRGFDDARGVDAGRALGSAQAQNIQAHAHPYHLGGSVVGTEQAASNWIASAGITANTDMAGGTETRPRNIALLACIKY